MGIKEVVDQRPRSGRILHTEVPPVTSNAGKLISYYDLLQTHISKLYDCIELQVAEIRQKSEWLESLVGAYRKIDHIVSIIVNSQTADTGSRDRVLSYLFDISGSLRVTTGIICKEILDACRIGEIDLSHSGIIESAMFLSEYESVSRIILDYYLSLYTASKPRLSVIEPDLSRLVAPGSPRFSREKKAEGYVNKSEVSQKHPGLLIASELEAANLSVADAATKLGMTRNQLHRIIRGDSDITQQTALQLEANKIGYSAREWLILQIDFNLSLHKLGVESRIGRPKAKTARAAISLKR